MRAERTAAFFLVSKNVLNVAFTIEAALRVSSYMPLSKAHRSIILWLDVLTVVPFWLRLLILPSTLLSPSLYFARQQDGGVSRRRKG